jgi:hypothetical protein
MDNFLESSKVFQKSYFKCSRKTLYRFHLREVRSHVFVETAQSCVRTPISVKKLRIVQSCILPDVMATCPNALQSLRRQLAPVWMSGQHRSDADILDKEITCIHFTFIQTTRQHRPDAVLVMAITYRQSATVRTLRQHRPDVALIWKRMKRVIESQLHRRLSRRSILPSRCCLEKSEIDSI